MDTTNNRKVDTTKINKQDNVTTQQSCYSQMKVQQCHDVETMRAKWEQLVRAKWHMGTPCESNSWNK